MAPGTLLDRPASTDGIPTKATTATITSSNAAVQQSLHAALARFEARNPKSKALHEEAALSLPGGNTRTLLHTSPFPISLSHGRGSKVYSVDNHEYTDLVGELSAGLYGHSEPAIVSALKATLDNVGLSLGGTTPQESVYASLLCRRFGLDRVRFSNSGTEANLHALAAARHFTGKRKIVVFRGGYHGAVLSFGHGVAVNNVDGGDWVLARYNDAEDAKRAIEGTEGLAAVLVEGMQGSGGCIPGEKDFLQTVESSAKKAGAVFILDEVMTSRMAPGGLKSTLGLSPDLTTLGKYLGGGLAFGAFGGRTDIMGVYDPRSANSIAHSGTFNNNTLAMNAGYAGLTEVFTPEACIEFTATGDKLRQRLQQVSKGTKCRWTGVGTLMNVHFTDDGVENILRGEDVTERDDLKDLFWLEMVEEGFWVHRRGMASLIFGTPQDELDRFVKAVEAFLRNHRDLVIA